MVADLAQLVCNGRGRTETADGALPTLTTNSGRLWSKASIKTLRQNDRA